MPATVRAASSPRAARVRGRRLSAPPAASRKGKAMPATVPAASSRRAARALKAASPRVARVPKAASRPRSAPP